MSFIVTIILTVQIVTAVAMIGLVLLQQGKGADMGAAFGSGSSGSLFGASGSANFLSRTTAVLATVFFVSTLALAYFSNARPVSTGSVLEGSAVPETASQIPGMTPGSAAPASTPDAPVAPVVPGPAQIPAR